MSAALWFIAGVAAALASISGARLLRRTAGMQAGPRAMHYLLAGGAVAVFALSAALIYAFAGAARLSQTAPSALAPHAGTRPMLPGAKAQSLEAATAGLEARLTRSGGSRDEWLLLAQSYEVMGRKEDARRARARAVEPGAAAEADQPAGASPAVGAFALDPASAAALLPPIAMPTQQRTDSQARATPIDPTATGSLPAAIEAGARQNPRDAQAWLALADLRRTQRDFPQARAAFLKVIALHAMDAQAWADYADVLGSLSGGSLGAAAGRAIERALAADPQNAKALWLNATRAYQEHRYADSLGEWEKLKSVLPPDSQDARIVDANIGESSQLAGIPVNTQSAADAASQASFEVSGTVTIDSGLADSVRKDAVLFVYAKAADSPGPPLAVMRTSVGAWPVVFHLDDSMAMVPSRRLSQFRKVIVEARISSSGQAMPTAGDLYVTSEIVQPGTHSRLALVINRKIG